MKSVIELSEFINDMNMDPTKVAAAQALSANYYKGGPTTVHPIMSPLDTLKSSASALMQQD